MINVLSVIIAIGTSLLRGEVTAAVIFRLDGLNGPTIRPIPVA